ncbi:MAG: CHAP domain-containing protein [Deltaproteobacteria bacterium]|nr:CHAP domain-containing protein [Deltaproteobacteria bacterium]
MLRKIGFALLLFVGLLPLPALAKPPVPANPAILAVLQRVETKLVDSAYVPVARVDERRGIYRFDCSAMANWVLRQVAPEARRNVKEGRPAARDFAAAIQRARSDKPVRGWLRIERFADAQPGDVLAWRRPPWFPSRNTGHVAFVVKAPVPVPGGYVIRIADATSLAHEHDSRQNTGGYGTGDLGITVDASTGQGSGYGWFGAASLAAGYAIPTPIWIGRVYK